jgi:hypothetical protein
MGRHAAHAGRRLRCEHCSSMPLAPAASRTTALPHLPAHCRAPEQPAAPSSTGEGAEATARSTPGAWWALGGVLLLLLLLLLLRAHRRRGHVPRHPPISPKLTKMAWMKGFWDTIARQMIPNCVWEMGLVLVVSAGGGGGGGQPHRGTQGRARAGPDIEMRAHAFIRSIAAGPTHHDHHAHAAHDHHHCRDHQTQRVCSEAPGAQGLGRLASLSGSACCHAAAGPMMAAHVLCGVRCRRAVQVPGGAAFQRFLCPEATSEAQQAAGVALIWRAHHASKTTVQPACRPPPRPIWPVAGGA